MLFLNLFLDKIMVLIKEFNKFYNKTKKIILIN